MHVDSSNLVVRQPVNQAWNVSCKLESTFYSEGKLEIKTFTFSLEEKCWVNIFLKEKLFNGLWKNARTNKTGVNPIKALSLKKDYKLVINFYAGFLLQCKLYQYGSIIYKESI